MITKVNKHTRSTKDGKEIICPKCDYRFSVYHFSWDALCCPSCKSDISKFNWLLELSHD
tara:strand:- start:290 stop:466 length:177 start_codon:yes stop_codon:yes gene_type:complete